MPRLGRDYWLSWKSELSATEWDRGFHKLLIGQEPLLDPTNTRVHTVAGVEVTVIGNIRNKNNAAYNQILLCISPELQTAIDDTNEATKV